MSDGLDAIISEYMRLAECDPATGAPRSDGARLRENLRKRVVDWATRPTPRQPAPAVSRIPEVRSDINQQPISLGFLGDDVEYICSSYLEDELREIEMRDHETNEEATENQQLADLLEWKQEFAEFVEPKIPLPDLGSDRHDDVLERMRRRVAVSSQKLPSSVMHTLLGTGKEATCMDMIDDGERMAVGFEESVIRVFDVTCAADSREDRHLSRRRFEDAIDGSVSNAPDDLEESEDETETDPCKTGPFPSVCYRGHTKSITATSFFKPHRVFLSSSIDGTVRLWSEALRTNICVYRGHLLPVLDVEFCPVGHYFLSGSMDESARLWCTESMEPIRIFPGVDGSVDLVRWHPGCSYFGSASSNAELRLWDISVARCVRSFKRGPRAMTCFRFGRDGYSVVCGYDDGRVDAIDLRKGAEIAVIEDAHAGPVWGLDCSRGNGNLVATGGEDGCLKLWSPPSKECIKSYATRSCRILNAFWTMSNLLVAAGVPSDTG